MNENGDIQKNVIGNAAKFARDLANGVAQNLWTAEFQVFLTSGGSEWSSLTEYEKGPQDPFDMLIAMTWNHKPPAHTLLRTLGYIALLRDSDSYLRYLLTQKSIDLLELPATPPSIFISYRRDQSSALALLIEARLKLAGNLNPFVDKNITPGDEWHGTLEGTIFRSEYFVSLVGPKTLESSMVLKEIKWAEAADCRIISIWHGCEINNETPDVLKKHHAIQITGESALEYETAVNQLLNSLGYPTY